MKLVQYVMLLSVLVVLFIVAGCKDNKEVDYQLQEQCKKNSEEFFKKSYDKIYSGFYINHYNKKLNKCFMVLYNPITNRNILYDVNKSNLHGLFTRDGVSCYVYEKKCKTEEEWNNLIKPYMEE
ncbi:MAG: hypothetical protein ACYDGO_05145 [Smithellaceae bacterium]